MGDCYAVGSVEDVFNGLCYFGWIEAGFGCIVGFKVGISIKICSGHVRHYSCYSYAVFSSLFEDAVAKAKEACFDGSVGCAVGVGGGYGGDGGDVDNSSSCRYQV